MKNIHKLRLQIVKELSKFENPKMVASHCNLFYYDYHLFIQKSARAF